MMPDDFLVRMPHEFLLGDYYNDSVAYCATQIQGRVKSIEKVETPIDPEKLFGSGTWIQTNEGSEFAGFLGEEARGRSGQSLKNHFLLLIGAQVYSSKDDSLRLGIHRRALQRTVELRRHHSVLFEATYRFPFLGVLRDSSDPDVMSPDIFEEICKLARAFAPGLCGRE